MGQHMTAVIWNGQGSAVPSGIASVQIGKGCATLVHAAFRPRTSLKVRCLSLEVRCPSLRMQSVLEDIDGVHLDIAGSATIGAVRHRYGGRQWSQGTPVLPTMYAIWKWQKFGL